MLVYPRVIPQWCLCFACSRAPRNRPYPVDNSENWCTQMHSSISGIDSKFVANPKAIENCFKGFAAFFQTSNWTRGATCTRSLVPKTLGLNKIHVTTAQSSWTGLHRLRNGWHEISRDTVDSAMHNISFWLHMNPNRMSNPIPLKAANKISDPWPFQKLQAHVAYAFYTCMANLDPSSGPACKQTRSASSKRRGHPRNRGTDSTRSGHILKDHHRVVVAESLSGLHQCCHTRSTARNIWPAAIEENYQLNVSFSPRQHICMKESLSLIDLGRV